MSKLMNELRDLPEDKLEESCKTLRQDILQCRFDRAMGRLSDVRKPRALRKKLARVLTRLVQIQKQQGRGV